MNVTGALECFTCGKNEKSEEADFGVAFEQGLFLPIPEGVPFRLTRDIVNGMGQSGTEGVFRRCCEETLRVLRHNSGPKCEKCSRK